MNIKTFNKKWLFSQIKIELIFLSLIIYNSFYNTDNQNIDVKKDIKISLCTMGKWENLYVKEFIEYYIKLGVNHIFIYDDNEPNTERLSKFIDKKYQYNVTVYDAKKLNVFNQSIAFTECYNNHNKKFDWFLMVDMDEFLYIVNDTLKGYLKNKRFNKCDFIKIHWVFPTDNDLVYYDPRPLFERFKPPYFKSRYVKSIIRGNISNLKYWIHTPIFSPGKNISCNNFGRRIYNKDVNIQSIEPKNIKKAYIVHFRYKSTEEFINKFKRGYSNWLKNDTQYMIEQITLYLKINKVTPEKIKFIERELNLNLSHYIKDIYKLKINKFSDIFR